METEIKEKPISKAQQKRNDQEMAKENLLKWIKPGDTVYTILRGLPSRSGMSRHISLVVAIQENGKTEMFDITWNVARLGDYRMNRDTGGIVIGGCGMDMGFSLVYSLGRRLFVDNFYCIGENCPANDHNNAYYEMKGDRCIVCRKSTTKSLYTRKNRENQEDVYRVCSLECSTGKWKHSDSGYALRHKWL